MKPADQESIIGKEFWKVGSSLALAFYQVIGDPAFSVVSFIYFLGRYLLFIYYLLFITNLLLTEREGRNGEYWPEVLAVGTERSYHANSPL